MNIDTIGIDAKSFLEQFKKDNDVKKMAEAIIAGTHEDSKKDISSPAAMPFAVRDFCLKAIEEAITANNKKIYEYLKNKGII